MIPVELILACTLYVAPATVQAIVSVESGGNPLAINVNGVGPITAVDLAEAISRTHHAINAGYTVDIGYMQVNSDSGARLGLSVEQMFDPCTNLRAGAVLLVSGYQQAASLEGPGQLALKSALSKYNTGNLRQGFLNGYVARYYGRRGAGSSGAAPKDPYTSNPTIFARPADRKDGH